VTPDAAYKALDPNRDWVMFRAAMRLRCPWCKAHPGHHCHSGGVPLALGSRVHPSRMALAAPQGA
jgi:hypothetical protein